jgi:hypothetical protein
MFTEAAERKTLEGMRQTAQDEANAVAKEQEKLRVEMYGYAPAERERLLAHPEEGILKAQQTPGAAGMEKEFIQLKKLMDEAAEGEANYYREKAAYEQTTANDEEERSQKRGEAMGKRLSALEEFAEKQEKLAVEAEIKEAVEMEDTTERLEAELAKRAAAIAAADAKREKETREAYTRHPEAAAMSAGEAYEPSYGPTPAQIVAATFTDTGPTGAGTATAPAHTAGYSKASIVMNTTINPPPNTDVRELARQILPEIERLLSRAWKSFSTG